MVNAGGEEEGEEGIRGINGNGKNTVKEGGRTGESNRGKTGTTVIEQQ